ncbi:MAG: hypothetical protein ACLSG7_03950 [Clostridia bacterium]
MKFLKIATSTITTLLLIDCIITGVALSFFLIRMIVKNDLNVADKQVIVQKYNDIYNDENLSNFVYKYWGDRKMIRTFPNIKVQDVNGDMIYMDSLLSDIQPYYYKFNIINRK